VSCESRELIELTPFLRRGVLVFFAKENFARPTPRDVLQERATGTPAPRSPTSTPHHHECQAGRRGCDRGRRLL